MKHVIGPLALGAVLTAAAVAQVKFGAALAEFLWGAEAVPPRLYRIHTEPLPTIEPAYRWWMPVHPPSPTPLAEPPVYQPPVYIEKLGTVAT